MKVLFYRYNSICEPDIMEVFSSVGLEVDVIDREMTDKKITNSERVELVSKRLSEESYLFVFSINFFPAISDVCNIYSVKYVGWSVDSPLPELFSKSIQNPCNRIFLFDRTQYEEVSEFARDNVFHLPLATNVSRWDKIISGITPGDAKKFSSDISFVGSLYSEKDDYSKIQDPSPYLKGFVDGLMKVQSNLQGINIIKRSLTPEIISELKEKARDLFPDEKNLVKNTDNYIASHLLLGMHCAKYERENILKAVSEYFPVSLYTRSNTACFSDCPNISVKGGVSTLTEMPKVFNLSKINLNITLRAIETGASLRIWDILGSGGFLMTNYQEELTEYFVAGEHYDFYTDIPDLIEKCDFYLKNEEVRKKIALNGYELVKRNHSYNQRIPEIIRQVLNNY